MNGDNFKLDKAGNVLDEYGFTAAKMPKNLVRNTTGFANDTMTSCLDTKYRFMEFMTAVVNGTEDLMFGSMGKMLASFEKSNVSDDESSLSSPSSEKIDDESSSSESESSSSDLVETSGNLRSTKMLHCH